MDINIYDKYAVINAEIKELTTQKDKIKELILSEMESNGEKKTVKAVGNFAISKLKTWTYTPRVAELNEEFNAQKATEQSNGEATFVEKDSLRFNPVKL